MSEHSSSFVSFFGPSTSRPANEMARESFHGFTRTVWPFSPPRAPRQARSIVPDRYPEQEGGEEREIAPAILPRGGAGGEARSPRDGSPGTGPANRDGTILAGDDTEQISAVPCPTEVITFSTVTLGSEKAVRTRATLSVSCEIDFLSPPGRQPSPWAMYPSEKTAARRLRGNAA